MFDLRRVGPAIPAPAVGVAFATSLLLAVVLSLTVQPPTITGDDTLGAALAWIRAGFFSAGALAFVVSLAVFVRSDSGAGARSPEPPVAGATAPPRTAYTVLALGVGPDDPRAITDAVSATIAVHTLRAWSAEHPDERVIIYSPDGTPAAFYRPPRDRRRSATPEVPRV